MLVEARILSNLDLIALEALVTCWSQCKRFETEGREIPASYFGQMKSLLAEFGLTPSTRNRIVKGKSEPTNKFENNGRKP